MRQTIGLIAFAILGPLYLGNGLYKTYKEMSLERSGIRTEAEIIDVLTLPRRNSVEITIRFCPIDSPPIEDSVRISLSEYENLGTVKIAYDQDDPESFKLVGINNNQWFSITVGLLMTLIAAFFIWSGLKSKKPPAAKSS